MRMTPTRDEAVITIPVDSETARIYAAASDEEQRRMQLLLRLQLRAWIADPQRSLSNIMDAIGEKAEQQGLNPEILAEIVRDEGLAS